MTVSANGLKFLGLLSAQVVVAVGVMDIETSALAARTVFALRLDHGGLFNRFLQIGVLFDYRQPPTCRRDRVTLARVGLLTQAKRCEF